MDTINTRDLYKKKCELEDLRDAVETAREELTEALEKLGYSADVITSILNDIVAQVLEDGDYSFPRADEVPEDIKQLASIFTRAELDYDSDDRGELAELETLETEVGISSFMHGTQLISEDDFEEYAEELAKETTGVNGITDQWPFNCIDWKMAADELQSDYSVASYQGTDYFFQS